MTGNALPTDTAKPRETTGKTREAHGRRVRWQPSEAIIAFVTGLLLEAAANAGGATKAVPASLDEREVALVLLRLGIRFRLYADHECVAALIFSDASTQAAADELQRIGPQAFWGVET